MILRGRSAFGRVFNQGRAVRTRRLMLKYYAEPDARPELLAGFIVRRSAGNAVRRNRIRRLMRESFRLRRSALLSEIPDQLRIHLALLWLPKSGNAADFDFRSIDSEMQQVLKRLVDQLKRSDGTTSDSDA
jgi:ribonuclease P protein component